MQNRGFWLLEGVTDGELVTSLKNLVTRGARTEARIVAHLAEVAARGLHLCFAPSLFRYCQKMLGLSENQAFYRIQAAQLARRFPVIFELLDEKRLHLTTLALLRDYLTVENHTELLSEAAGKTKLQICNCWRLARRARTCPTDCGSWCHRATLSPRVRPVASSRCRRPATDCS